MGRLTDPFGFAGFGPREEAELDPELRSGARTGRRSWEELGAEEAGAIADRVLSAPQLGRVESTRRKR